MPRSALRILVTGGAGYVGSFAVARLLADGHDVVVYDDLSKGHAAAVPAGRLVRGDLRDGPRLRSVLAERRIEAVMHFAARALVAESVADPALYWDVNVGGTLALLEAMRATGVARVVFSSSCAVYGEPERVPIAEDAPQRPVSPYGFTKLAAERALDHYARAYGIGFASLRYFNACGGSPDGSRGEDHDAESHVIPLALHVALGRRDRFRILGDDYPTADGTCIRDYVHVEDLADAHVRALALLEPGRGAWFNLGTGRGFSVREVVEACRRASGRAIPVEVAPRRDGDPAELVADPSRAKAALGWEARYTDLDAIAETAWRWHESHPHGYASADGRGDGRGNGRGNGPGDGEAEER